MNKTVSFIILFAPLIASGKPVVTISCDGLKGTVRDYGVPATERMKAASEHKAVPQDRLSAPYNDGWSEKVTFIVDSSRASLTMLWTNPTEPAREIPVLAFSPQVITAMEHHTGFNGAADLYSFYPKLGVVFFSRHYLDPGGADATQSSFFGKCQFTWSGLPP
jgi:hypothetical protein